jgi:hypothetical protein
VQKIKQQNSGHSYGIGDEPPKSVSVCLCFCMHKLWMLVKTQSLWLPSALAQVMCHSENSVSSSVVCKFEELLF